MRFITSRTNLAIAMLIGICIGLGSFTFNYAEGLSYLSNNPRACVNCHIMNDQYSGLDEIFASCGRNL
ncbi:hypothetical protein BH09PLA1_BH09PLA1_11250 [soil metagenome]